MPDLAVAHGRGSVDAVETKWRQLPLTWQSIRARHGITSPGFAFPGILPLVDAAGAQPRLRQLYPFTSHFTLLFSSCTRYPYLVEAPAVEPLRDGRFRVCSPRGGAVIGETETAEEAVILVITHLPDGLGPAVAGTADDLGR
ncbi:DUF6193 family natural product biosynthesis protein [Streptomyces sp. NBC_00038]|uniref:DUF6193 family natural product biosynthesis protein n=1 Tax=Streptomyces sp. NBC_00038 TaxID=2903615 RepID=UPI00225B8AA8|nr:DUF6193 family natural product biosynthesis protein [Streptomyces sp. NBC_00038]MCX5554493.1 DUF6193 family natural product biosynthesis protein [Streptomyces sp. NBC_00038]